jgi:DHA1 family bicyclomycin/chloramphenicol resistance-like MFS transporter
MSSARSLTTTIIIASLVAIGPLSTDMYLPAFPALIEVFSSDIGQVQITLSVFMVGFAVAQLISGPLSDRFGRKPVLMVALVLFLLSSIAIAYSSSIEMLIALRFTQAIGGSAGPVLGRAMVRDIYGPHESARLLSYISTAMALAPAAAPIMGGYMLVWFGWESIFLFLAFYALVGLLLMAYQVPETAPPSSHGPMSSRRLLDNYLLLLRHPTWRWYSLSGGFVFAGLFAFLSGAPFVVIDYFGFSEQQFGLFFTLVVIGFMVGTLIGGGMVRRVGINPLIGMGAFVALTGGSVMGILAFLQVDHISAVLVPHMLYMVGVGIVVPQSMAGALAPFPKIAGTSSALLGFFQMTLAALVGVLVGQFHDGSPFYMALAIAMMGGLTVISYVLLRRAIQRQANI